MSEPKQTMEALVENTGEAPSAGSPEATAKKEKKKPVRGNKRKKKIKKILLWVLIILAVLAFISYKMGFFGGNTGMQNTETYNTFSVVRRDIQNVLTGTGTLAPADSYTVTALASKSTVRSAPIPAGIRTAMSSLPIPSTSGVYSPSGISSVEKLIPGAITLNAIQKPQNRYQPNDGAMVT